jgi:hypothetical protein
VVQRLINDFDNDHNTFKNSVDQFEKNVKETKCESLRRLLDSLNQKKVQEFKANTTKKSNFK